ncbi:hypothetical protein AAG906_016236 [Vitis piasezkii]
MIYTPIDIFYLINEQLKNSPSRKDGISEATETTFRICGCDLIQKAAFTETLCSIMATGQVLFHRHCKKVASSYVWLVSKLEESPRKARQVLIVFHIMEYRKEYLPVVHLDPFSKEILHSGPSANNGTVTPKEASKLINSESGESKNSMVKRSIPSKSEHRTEASGERNNERDKDRERERNGHGK